jgi:protein ImuA
MDGLQRHQALQTLRDHIETLERRPPLAERFRHAGQAGAGPFALPGGALHEVFAQVSRDAGAGLGFALGLARRLLTSGRRVVLYCELVQDAQARGLPYGPGLVSFGFQPESLVMARVETVANMLWVMEEALGTAGIAAVIADLAGEPRALDFTAARRLALRAATSGSSVFLVRTNAPAVASPAQWRWQVSPAPSAEMAFDTRAPGAARWRIELKKGRIPGGGTTTNWLVEWSNDGLLVIDEQQVAPRAAAPAHGALPATLGDRLSEAS